MSASGGPGLIGNRVYDYTGAPLHSVASPGNHTTFNKAELGRITRGELQPPPAWGIPNFNDPRFGPPNPAGMPQPPAGGSAQYGAWWSQGGGRTAGQPAAGRPSSPFSPFGPTGGEFSRMSGWANRNLPNGLNAVAGRMTMPDPSQRVPFFWRLFGANPPARMPGAPSTGNATAARQADTGVLI